LKLVVLDLAFRVLSKMEHDPEKRATLKQMADEMHKLRKVRY
jgi:hypothetical protein